MPWLYDYKCDHCGLAFPTGWRGHAYVTRKSGERVLCSLLDAKEVQEITGLTPRQAEADGRYGFLSNCLCFDCLAQFNLDVDRDVKQCPKCGSLKVRTAKGSVGALCPACKVGCFRERNTGTHVCDT
jgi:hypothetical protein